MPLFSLVRTYEGLSLRLRRPYRRPGCFYRLRSQPGSSVPTSIHPDSVHLSPFLVTCGSSLLVPSVPNRNPSCGLLMYWVSEESLPPTPDTLS